MAEHRFAIQIPRTLTAPTCHWIPWEMIAPHETQAQANHHQSLEQLNERGGLSPAEAVAVLQDRPCRPGESEKQAAYALNRLWREFHGEVFPETKPSLEARVAELEARVARLEKGGA